MRLRRRVDRRLQAQHGRDAGQCRLQLARPAQRDPPLVAVQGLEQQLQHSDELVARADIPARVVIAEYVDVANAFFDEGQPGLVNGVLDALARRLRNGELAESADSSTG